VGSVSRAAIVRKLDAMTRASFSILLAFPLAAALVGCGKDDDNKACDLADPEKTCKDGQVCEDVAGQPLCVAPVVVRGRVTDSDSKGIAGALVTALDANDAPATGTATSGSDGAYELRIPLARGEGGALMGRKVKLRASAAGYETFPSGLRRSLPMELAGAVAMGNKVVLQNSATDIVLFPIVNPGGMGSIGGTVEGPAGKRGVLVVAERPGGAETAISDAGGGYVIFNVPPGEYTVKGYAVGIQLEPATVTVMAGARATANLKPRDVPLGTVTGSVNIVNAPGGAMTSVVLVVASTFNEDLKRGEVPPGLRAPSTGAPNITGPFMITDVPDGSYKVLAAFEDDGLVRDPDTSIAGTGIQSVTVQEGAREVMLSASFKVTGALAVVSPGAGDVPDVVSDAPTFVWKDDSSEEGYWLEVLDAKGVVWKNPDVPKVTGGDVMVPYQGPPLTKGALYQFRATSYRRGMVPISQTEDLKGVFLVQ
jgi:hypothetical protein